MFARIFALVIAVSPGVTLAQVPVTDFMLDNGMQVVVVEDHRAPVVTHMVWYKVGAADEDPGKSGIAHFLEHLMFKKTANLASGELSDTVAANGGSDNAFTSQDYTAYFQRVAADRLDLMMQMESDRMTGLQLSVDDIATERDVVIEERNQRTENSPGAMFREQINAAQYLNHPYGIPIIGWRHELSQLNLQDAVAFYKRHYAPNNAILMVAGDVTPDQVRTLAEKHYGVIPANPAVLPRMRPQEPPQLSARRMAFRDPRVSQPYVTRGYLAPERDSGDQKTAAALVYLAEILGGSGATSVLGQELQFETQQAIYTSAYYGGMSLDDTTFGLVAVPAPGVSLQQIEDAMDVVIADFMVADIDTELFDRIKMQLRASEIYAQDDVQGIGRRYGQALTQGLTVQDVKDWPKILQAVTPDDVKQAAELVFNRKASVTGWLMGLEEQNQ
ncbi:MAG: M16 family metallopeptidase [Planktomarina sp.]